MSENKHIMTHWYTVIPSAILCCLLWGSAFPCIKIGYKMFGIAADDNMSQLLFAGVRFTLAGIMVIIVGSIMQKKLLHPSPRAVPKAAVLSLFQTVLQYTFFYLGLARTTGMKSSIITASNVFFAIIFSTLIFRHEKPSPKKIIGCIIGFAGVVLINLSSGEDMSFRLSGEGLILLSAASYGMSASFSKRFSKTEDPVMLSGYQFLMGGIAMTAFGVFSGGSIGHAGLSGAVMLGYLAFISAAAFTVWGILLKYNPVSRISVLGFMNPVFGVILSAVLLSENNSASPLRIIISLLLITIGIITVNIQKSHSTP